MGSRLSTTHRNLQAELMDDPDLDADAHRRALRGIARINTISRTAETLWPAIRDLAEAKHAAHTAPGAPPPRPLQLLDVACGGGDVTRKLWQYAQQAKVPLAIHGCDVSPTALTHAREQAQAIGANIVYLACDVLRDPLPGPFDVMICTLFLHHLNEEAATTVLRKMAMGSDLVLVSDLVRTPLALVAAYIGTRLLSRSRIVHVDGPRSVQGAYTPAELRQLAREAGLEGAQVQTQFPTRMMLTWRRT